MNRGDARVVPLTILIDDQPITEGYADEIELTFNQENNRGCVKKKLSTGDITWDSERSQYVTILTQEDTFKFKAGQNTYQFRLLVGNEVISSIDQPIYVGRANSNEVLYVEDNSELTTG